MTDPTRASRITASFLCLAVTDALGAPLEFRPRRHPSSFVTSMLANGNFGLPPGHFTDDTSMALCLACSLLDSQGQTNVQSQARAYVDWYTTGFMSSVPGQCFDIGNQTRDVLELWDKAFPTSSPPDSAEQARLETETMSSLARQFSEERNCGNGSLMRVLPCALMAASEAQAVRLARESSQVTHPHARNGDACDVYVRLVYAALSGRSKDDLVETMRRWVAADQPGSVDGAVRDRLKSYGSVHAFVDKPRSEISSSGYVVDTLEAALWAFFSTDNYREGAIAVVNLGNDADTVGAVYGGLAGAFYGSPDIIPQEWSDMMKALHMVQAVIDRMVHYVQQTE